MFNWLKKNFTYFLPLIFVFLLINFHFSKNHLLTRANTYTLNSEDLVFLNRVWELVNKNFVDPSKIDKQKAILEAARGLLRSLDDPYSEILDQNQAKIFEEDMSGSFGGVGMEIGIRDGVLTVIAPLDGTPAQRAGLKSGDKILKINGEETKNMPLDVAVSKIRGEPGTKVVLTIYREEWIEPKEIELIREVIEIPVIKEKLISRNIGYIKINSFNLKTYPEFLKAYYRLKSQGAKYWIFDLRNNPGGYLNVAIQMTELFLPRGKVILQEEERGGKIKKIYSNGSGLLKDLKFVILLNKGSASASEIFAGALRDNLGIKIIGEKSYGKGSVQQVFYVDNKMVKLTVAYWLTPNGLRLEGNGLEPDIKVKEIEPDKIKTELDDPVIKKAVEFLRYNKVNVQ